MISLKQPCHLRGEEETTKYPSCNKIIFRKLSLRLVSIITRRYVDEGFTHTVVVLLGEGVVYHKIQFCCFFAHFIAKV